MNDGWLGAVPVDTSTSNQIENSLILIVRETGKLSSQNTKFETHEYMNKKNLFNTKRKDKL